MDFLWITYLGYGIFNGYPIYDMIILMDILFWYGFRYSTFGYGFFEEYPTVGLNFEWMSIPAFHDFMISRRKMCITLKVGPEIWSFIFVMRINGGSRGNSFIVKNLPNSSISY